MTAEYSVFDAAALSGQGLLLQAVTPSVTARAASQWPHRCSKVIGPRMRPPGSAPPMVPKNSLAFGRPGS